MVHTTLDFVVGYIHTIPLQRVFAGRAICAIQLLDYLAAVVVNEYFDSSCGFDFKLNIG
jgi:hypothetical protein